MPIMCGIAGKVSFEGGEIDSRLLEKMGTALQHRGPEDQGIYNVSGAGLVHRRLKIIDLSPAGHQPMTNEDETLWLVFNGEIYNFQPLRDRLEERGHRFRSRTDTEVILHLYEDEGDQVVDHLRGMFAFALWDSRRRRLLLARDRVGKKPLYYTQRGQTLLFASELAALLEDPGVPREPVPELIDTFLTLQYVPAPMTLFQGIRKLEPGHVAVFDEQGFRTQRYWRLNYEPKLEIDEVEAERLLLEKLKESVRLRMIADVPLGAFLSGGVDSSGVVALMAEQSTQPVKTFSIGFEDEDYSEVGYARMVAKRYGTDHHEFIVKPEALEVLPLLVRHFGEPFGDSSAIPTYYVSKVTRQHVTVALNGDGGDESFAGYERHLGNRIISGLRRLPRLLLDIPAMALDIFPEQTGQAPLLRRVKRLLHYARAEGDLSYFRMLTIFDRDDRLPLYTPEFREKIGAWEPWAYLKNKLAESDAKDPVDRLLALDATSYLSEDLLPKVDITSMVHALETRSPLLDHELMEFAARLPGAFKLSGRNGKKILKRALHSRLPAEIITRRKMGFGVPLGGWFKGPMKEYIREHLLDGRARGRGYFAAAPVEQLLAEHFSGRRDHGYRLYCLLQLELWHRAFLDRP